jgi:multiple sugar transport system substrate-binding protein
MTGIFLSYRRADSSGWAGRLHERLADHWGADQVFIDIDAIGPGEDFRHAIARTMEASDVVIVVIGPHWLDARDDAGNRRLDDPADTVRAEVASALASDVLVVPVLVGGAAMPTQSDLPEALQDLAFRNAAIIDDRRFGTDVRALQDALSRFAANLAAQRTAEPRAGPETAEAPAGPETAEAPAGPETAEPRLKPTATAHTSKDHEPRASDRGPATRGRETPSARRVSGSPRRVRRAPRWTVLLAITLLLGMGGALIVLLTSGEPATGLAELTWYIYPDNGGQEDLAKKCSEASDGAFKIEIATLPADTDDQREELVRRLAANDDSIDLMSLDPVFVPEFAEAGYLRPFTEDEASEFTDDVLAGPLTTATWKDQLVAAPFWANTQLLWYRKSVAERAGIDPEAGPLTWDQIIDAAKATGTTVEVTGAQYEGYMVWINTLVASAGGEVLKDPEAGKDAQPDLDSAAGKEAATIIHRLATDGVANPQLSTATEETARAGFQADNGGFMVNWPYIYGAALQAVDGGSLDQSVVDDIGWVRVPEVTAGTDSAPALGGSNLGIGAFGKHQNEAVDAARCITATQSQIEYMLKSGTPGAKAAVFDDPEVRQRFPMADLIRTSIDEAMPRPRSPYYADVSASVVAEFHPQTSVDPESTPARADERVANVLQSG